MPTAQGGVGGASVAVTDPQERWGTQQSNSATRRPNPHQAKETRRTRGESVWGVAHPWCHELPPLAAAYTSLGQSQASRRYSGRNKRWNKRIGMHARPAR